MGYRHGRRSQRRTHRHRRRIIRRRATNRHRRQQGGAKACAAYPLNYEAFSQRGGMAPVDAPSTYLSSDMARQAEIGPQIQAFAELPRVLAAAGVQQHGGKRRSRRGRKQRRRRISQRGGMAPLDWSLSLGAPGANPQFASEASVWAPGAAAKYSETLGPQA